MMEEQKEETDERINTHLRQSNNGNPISSQQVNQGLEGFAGIVGVGFGGGKRAGLVPTTASKGKK